mmetsp:Transcript_113085/g.326726  ORF Transcript_113085/g.326726 Transcript_113085/m.326726 type:complete len:727 (-) Transcript_113085:49-2229(-)
MSDYGCVGHEEWLTDSDNVALRGLAHVQEAHSPLLFASTDVRNLLQHISGQLCKHEEHMETILTVHAEALRTHISEDLMAAGAMVAREGSLPRRAHSFPGMTPATSVGRVSVDYRGDGDAAGGARATHCVEGRGRGRPGSPLPLPRAQGRSSSQESGGAGSMEVSSMEGPWNPPRPAEIPDDVSIVEEMGSPPVVAWLEASNLRSGACDKDGVGRKRPPAFTTAWTTDQVAQDTGPSDSRRADTPTSCPSNDRASLVKIKGRRPRRTGGGKSLTARVSHWRGSLEFGGRSRSHDWGDEFHCFQTFTLALRKLICNRRFEFLSAVLILLNAASIGLESDWSLRHLGEPMPMYMEAFETFFAIAFSVELVLRIGADGRGFLHRENMNLAWNIFDIFVVITCWCEKFVGFVTAGGADVSVLRVLQIFRLVRILRIIRVMRFFKELRLMVQGIAASLKPLVWCIVLLCLVMFTFGVFIVQTIATHLAREAPNPKHKEILRYFGGLGQTIYTLYAAIIGGIDWDDAAQFLFDIHPLLAMMFSMYVAFAVLCMLNIVTGVFVEHANAITKADADNMVMEELCLQEKRLAEMRVIFERMVEGESNTEKLSYRQFQRFAQNEKVQAYFRRIGLSVDNENANALFTLIDLDNDGMINLEEFVAGCMQFIGAARQLDIARLRRDNAEIREIVRAAVQLTESKPDLGVKPSASMSSLSRSKSRIHPEPTGATGARAC